MRPCGHDCGLAVIEGCSKCLDNRAVELVELRKLREAVRLHLESLPTPIREAFEQAEGWEAVREPRYPSSWPDGLLGSREEAEASVRLDKGDDGTQIC